MWPGEWYLDAGALLIALVIDLALREVPTPVHPVVWMGRLASWLERAGPSSSGRAGEFVWGICLALIVPGLFAVLSWAVANILRELGALPYLVGVGVLLSTTFAVSGLARAARNVESSMNSGDLAETRNGLRSLVSRDPTSLSPALVAAAAIESVAENTTDSYIGPWLAYAVLGLPGAFAYRAINTLDSMIGYRGKYEFLGKASAKLDDGINLVPARLSALMIVMSGTLLRLSPRRGWTWVWEGRRMTESPNAGWTIGAMAGLLGVALEKPGHYCIGVGMADPGASHIGTSTRVAYAVAAIGLVVSLCVLALRGLASG
ncbi:MAG: adenosylcobinamide-phosphate synthase CbiB [Dehalococcoidia bacterium]|nr:adenosylcobinamide-phosphate synthase CbiB [Dehalococcoidia bacterium]